MKFHRSQAECAEAEEQPTNKFSELLHADNASRSNAEFWRIQLPRRDESVAGFARIQSMPRRVLVEEPKQFLVPT